MNKISNLAFLIFFIFNISQINASVNLKFDCTDDIKSNRLNIVIEGAAENKAPYKKAQGFGFSCLEPQKSETQIAKVPAGAYDVRCVLLPNKAAPTHRFLLEDDKTYQVNFTSAENNTCIPIISQENLLRLYIEKPINSNTLNNRFELTQAKETFELGRGGSGIVTLGQYDKNSHQFLVLKELYLDLDRFLSEESSSGRQLVNEVCANLELGKLKHVYRGIAAGLKEEKNIYFAVVPSLGGSAQDVLEYFVNNPTRLTPEWIRFLIANIALGIDSIHKSGWNWLDNTLRNILIDYDTGYAKIVDFGESSRQNDLTASNQLNSINNYRSIADWYYLGKNVLKKLLEANINKNELADNLFLLQNDLIGNGKDSIHDSLDNLHTIEALKNHIAFKDFNWKALEDGEMIPSFVPKNKPMYIDFLYNKNPQIKEWLKEEKLKSYTMRSDENFSVDSGLLSLLKKVPFNGMSKGLRKKINRAENIKDLCNIHKNFFDNMEKYN